MHKEETQREKSKRNIAEVKEITCKGTKKKEGSSCCVCTSPGMSALMKGALH